MIAILNEKGVCDRFILNKTPMPIRQLTATSSLCTVQQYECLPLPLAHYTVGISRSLSKILIHLFTHRYVFSKLT